MGCHVEGNGRYMRVIAMMTARRKLPTTVFLCEERLVEETVNKQDGGEIPFPVAGKLKADCPLSERVSVFT